MANIYLHLLDEAVNEKCRVPSGYTPCTVRYADGLVILRNPGEGEGLKERLERVDIVQCERCGRAPSGAGRTTG